MTAPPRPRAPLPRRVYWVRRLVLLLVVAVVLGTGYGLVSAAIGAWSDDGAPTRATAAGAQVPATPAPTDQPSPESSRSPAGSSSSQDAAPSGDDRPRRVIREPLPEPEGVCPDDDVVVAPHVTQAHVGEPIRIVLQVSTDRTPACTWEVGPDSVFLKVVRDDDGAEVVWSSQHCPAVMPTAQVVARRQQAAEVVVSWSGRISDEECSTVTGWVLPGRYRAVSIARGAVTPLDEAFRLEEAVPEVVVVPPTPSPETSPDVGPTAGPTPGEDASGGEQDER